MLRNVSLALALFACQHAASSSPPSDASPRAPAVTAPFVVTYTSQDLGAAGGPLHTMIVSSSGDVSETIGTTRTAGHASADQIAAIGAALANPALAKLRSVPLAGEGVDIWIEAIVGGAHAFTVELADGVPPEAQALVAALDPVHPTTPAPVPPFANLHFETHEEGARLGPTTTIDVDQQGRASQIVGNRVPWSAQVDAATLATLALEATALEMLPSEPPRGEGVRVSFDVTRADGSHTSVGFGDGAPLAVMPLVARLGKLDFQPPAKSDTGFVRVTYASQMFGVAAGPKQVLTIAADGTLTATENGKPNGSGHAKDLSALRAALAGFDQIQDEPALGEGVQATVTVTTAAGDRSVKLFAQGAPDAQALVAALRDLQNQVTR